jgi:hypothetical protein
VNQPVVATPEYLKELAGHQDSAAAKSASASQKTKDLAWDCWWTHGVVSGCSNQSAGDTQAVRAEAAAAIANASSDLSVRLRVAAETYTDIDLELAANFKNQMRDK